MSKHDADLDYSIVINKYLRNFYPYWWKLMKKNI